MWATLSFRETCHMSDVGPDAIRGVNFYFLFFWGWGFCTARHYVTRESNSVRGFHRLISKMCCKWPE